MDVRLLHLNNPVRRVTVASDTLKCKLVFTSNCLLLVVHCDFLFLCAGYKQHAYFTYLNYHAVALQGGQNRKITAAPLDSVL